MTQTISHPDMVRKLFKDPADIIGNLSLYNLNLLHAAVGLAGEAGEVLEITLYLDTDKVSDELKARFADELGDVEFYLEALKQAIGAESFSCESQAYESHYRHAAGRVAYKATDILDTVKKMVFNGRDLGGRLESSVANMDAWLSVLRQSLGITREQTLQANITKLGARYQGFEYSDEAAAARRDES